MRIELFGGGAFAENCWLLSVGSQSVLVDPGAGAAQALERLKATENSLEAVWLTHAHIDHIEGIAQVVRHTGAPIWLHPDDRQLYDNVHEAAEQYGVTVETPPPVDRHLAHGMTLDLAGVAVEVRFTPGHSPGHVVFVIPSEELAIVGDTVFAGSIGRTDLQGGSTPTLMRSIQDHLLSLPDNYQLLPGHGPVTVVGTERRQNPFLVNLELRLNG